MKLSERLRDYARGRWRIAKWADEVAKLEAELEWKARRARELGIVADTFEKENAELKRELDLYKKEMERRHAALLAGTKETNDED